MKLHSSIFIFDLDGTLVDSRIDISNSVNKMLRQMNRSELSVDVITSYVGDGVRKLLARCLQTEDRELVLHCQQIFLKEYEMHCLEHTTLYPHVLETLEHFKDKFISIVTNKPRYITENIVDGLQIRKYFKKIIGGDSAPQKKPKPDPILLALPENFDISKNSKQVVIVGDGKPDMEVARLLNTTSCFVKYGYESYEKVKMFSPDFCIDSLYALTEIFN